MIEVTPDDNPIVGWTHLANVYTVAGFSGHGMCLAPGLAPEVARELQGRPAHIALDIYRLERFERGGVAPEGVWGGLRYRRRDELASLQTSALFSSGTFSLLIGSVLLDGPTKTPSRGVRGCH